MIKLSGILEYSMGGFLCLRGFASFRMLSAISQPNPDVQRNLIDEHRGEMARFLSQGEYRFFPEVILSTNLTDGKRDFDIVSVFHSELQSGDTWNKNVGEFSFSISQNKTKNVINQYSTTLQVDRLNIAHIKFDETKVIITRIDGNHRRSASDSVNEDFKIPFCLLLFGTPQENEQYSRAIFHNINAKQIPLKLEENLKVILESPDVFSDEKLKNDPSFGWKYYLSRCAANQIDFSMYPFINALVGNSKYTYLLEVFTSLLKRGELKEEENAVNVFCSKLGEIEDALREAQLHSVPQNISVIGALSYYKLVDDQQYTQFMSWVKKNSIAQAPDIHICDLISIYDKVYESTPKNIFMSMWFSDKTMDTYQTLKDVRDILKREDGIEFRIIKVDEHKDGFSDEIYRRIVDGIDSSSLVIADLSYGNHNVHHEIGYAQGKGKKVMLLYQMRDEVGAEKEIGSNLSMHDQIRFHNQTELRPILLRRVREFFGIKTE